MCLSEPVPLCVITVMCIILMVSVSRSEALVIASVTDMFLVLGSAICCVPMVASEGNSIQNASTPDTELDDRL